MVLIVAVAITASFLTGLWVGTKSSKRLLAELASAETRVRLAEAVVKALEADVIKVEKAAVADVHAALVGLYSKVKGILKVL